MEVAIAPVIYRPGAYRSGGVLSVHRQQRWLTYPCVVGHGPTKPHSEI